VRLYPDGRIEKERVIRCSAAHQFILDDINGDQTNEIIIADNNTLKAISSEGEILFSFTAESDITSMQAGHRLNQPGYIAIQTASNQLHLLDYFGREMKGFPIPSKGFSFVPPVYGNTNFHLYIAGIDNFLYHYYFE
jgi:hypothetical protein